MTTKKTPTTAKTTPTTQKKTPKKKTTDQGTQSEQSISGHQEHDNQQRETEQEKQHLTRHYSSIVESETLFFSVASLHREARFLDEEGRHWVSENRREAEEIRDEMNTLAQKAQELEDWKVQRLTYRWTDDE